MEKRETAAYFRSLGERDERAAEQTHRLELLEIFWLNCRASLDGKGMGFDFVQENA